MHSHNSNQKFGFKTLKGGTFENQCYDSYGEGNITDNIFDVFLSLQNVPLINRGGL